jgi:hypothetical protein
MKVREESLTMCPRRTQFGIGFEPVREPAMDRVVGITKESTLAARAANGNEAKLITL